MAQSSPQVLCQEGLGLTQHSSEDVHAEVWKWGRVRKVVFWEDDLDEVEELEQRHQGEGQASSG